MSKDTSSSSTNDLVIQAMQQQFERMFNMMAGVNEKLERHDGILNQLQGEPRQRRRPPIDQEDYEGEDDLDDDQVTLVGQQINPRRQARRGRQNDDVDCNLGSIKMKIPSFQGRNDPDVYFEWERKVELIFECHNYSEEKKVKLTADKTNMNRIDGIFLSTNSLLIIRPSALLRLELWNHRVSIISSMSLDPKGFTLLYVLF